MKPEDHKASALIFTPSPLPELALPKGRLEVHLAERGLGNGTRRTPGNPI